MNYNKLFYRFLAMLFFVACQVRGEALLGRAVIASMRGDIYYEWDGGSKSLKEGMALTDGHRIVAGNGAALCAVLSPGAILCVQENSIVDLTELKHAVDGLPQDGKATKRIISLDLSKGAIMLTASEMAVDRSIEVSIGHDLRLFSSGGEFIVATTRNERRIHVKEGGVTVESDGVVDELESGARLVFELQRSGDEEKWVKTLKSYSVSGISYDFSICRKFFPALAPLVSSWNRRNFSKLNEWIEPSPGIAFVSNAKEIADVSPSIRHSLFSKHRAIDIPAYSSNKGQWRRPDVWSWYRGIGSLRGVNYLPRTAVNSIDMWRKDNFDLETIDEELEWANESGLDSVRVFLPFAVWNDNAKDFKKRVRRFLSLADDHGISTVFVLFDDKHVLDGEPYIGPQPDPLPGVHNSCWVASPGHALVAESAGKWPVLKKYVEDVVQTFAGDKRVLMWDLYNQAGSSGMGGSSLPLLNASFEWVRGIKPDQPITAGISYAQTQQIRQKIMKKSDVITLADYGSAEDMSEILTLVSSRGRPVICTGWLNREQRSTFKEILPVFSKYEVGWYHWGLVQGKTQLYLSQNIVEADVMPKTWDQDLLKPNGKPFDENEIKLIKGFSFE